MGISLLDFLANETGVEFLSDLRGKPYLCTKVLCSLPNPRIFSIDEWNDAGTYLSEYYVPQTNPEAAYRFILDLCLEDEG